MQRHAGRLAGGVLLLAALWIGVYWLWPAEPAITFAGRGSRAHPQPRDHAPVLVPVVSLPQPEPAVLPPEFDEHVVRPGETLESISRDRYGTPDHASTIARANPLADPARMRPGRTLKVPRDTANVQGLPAANARTPKAEDLERTYVVKSGDSLSKISVEMFGTSRFSGLLYDANRGILKNEHSLSVGQTLRVPPRPRGGGS